MTEPSEELKLFRQCIADETAKPELTPEELVEKQSLGLAALLDAAGIEACRTGTVAGIGFLPPFAAGGSISSGCEQLAAISSSMDANQKIFNCAFAKFSNSQATTVISNLQIDFTADAFSAQNCFLQFTQEGKVDVVKYTSLQTDVQNEMNSRLNATMERFVENIQSEEKKGLFGTSEGQKTIQNFAQSVNNDIKNGSYTNVINNIMEQYNQSGRININLGTSSSMSFANPGKSGSFPPPCIIANQKFNINLISTNIISNTLKVAFSSDAGTVMRETIRNIQKRSSDTGFTLPGFGAIAIIVVVVIILIVLLSLKGKSDGSGSNQPPKPVLSGPAGKITGIVLMVLGFSLVITAIIMFILQVNAIISSLVLLGGLIFAGFGIGIFLKARSQQTEFEQKIQLSRIQQGLPPLTAEQLHNAVDPSKAKKQPKILPAIPQQYVIPSQQPNSQFSLLPPVATMYVPPIQLPQQQIQQQQQSPLFQAQPQYPSIQQQPFQPQQQFFTTNYTQQQQPLQQQPLLPNQFIQQQQPLQQQQQLLPNQFIQQQQPFSQIPQQQTQFSQFPTI